MTSYRETFRRHRRLLLAPIVLAMIFALWSALGAPKSYRSTASLWVDNPPPASSSLTNSIPGAPTPAEQEQAMVAELLKTRGFRLSVGHHSPLASYLAKNSGHGWGPTALVHALKGDGGLDSRILSALGSKQVITTVAGPQVLQVSYAGATPEVAQQTLEALLKQLETQAAHFDRIRGEDALAYYRSQVDAASNAVANARQEIARYLNEHPGATVFTDPNLKALRQAQTGASNRLASATSRVNQASGSVAAPGAVANGVAEIDPPTAPTGPSSGHKKVLLALIGGLFAGAVISFLGAVALTPGQPEGTSRSTAPVFADESGAVHAIGSGHAAGNPLGTIRGDSGNGGVADAEPSNGFWGGIAGGGRHGSGRRRPAVRPFAAENGSAPVNAKRAAQPRTPSSANRAAQPRKPSSPKSRATPDSQ
jgi:uncharacterized protein involved in exopolysaccharide biosynthesis